MILSKASMITATVVLAAALTLPPASRSGQAPVSNADPAQAAIRARNIAQNFENNARLLTIFDREGRAVATLGARDMYGQPAFSPDGTRIAAVKNDLEKETPDIWVLDVKTGQAIRITSNQPRQTTRTPVWSPDGKQLAYVVLRDGYEGLYRRNSNGEGDEELLYRHPGSGMTLTDWSLDGRYLSFYTQQLAESVLFTLPLDGDRSPFAQFRSQFQLVGGRISPDGRLIVYRSNETGRNEIFVRTFNPPGRETRATEGGPWQISREGGLGLLFWRLDGTELYYMDANRNLKVVSVSTAPTVRFGAPQTLFKLPESMPVTGTPGGLGNVSRDGQRVVIAVPPMPQLQQITVYDRRGNVTRTVGQPGLYFQPALSPDGRRLAVVKNDRDAGRQDIWTFDISTGRGAAVSNDPYQDNSPIWSRDGSRILYVSTRGSYAGIYRKAIDGSGEEELLFRYTAGAGLTPNDVSPNGRFVTFSSGGVLLVVPLTGTDPLRRSPVEFSRSEFDAREGRFSPDGLLMAYLSNEMEPTRSEVYVQPFDASSGGAAGENKWKVSSGGANGMLTFRADGREILWVSTDPLSGDAALMSVEISTASSFQHGTPQRLFTLPDINRTFNGPGSISPDGQSFVFLRNVREANPVK